jgi:hypothetical protein
MSHRSKITYLWKTVKPPHSSAAMAQSTGSTGGVLRHLLSGDCDCITEHCASACPSWRHIYFVGFVDRQPLGARQRRSQCCLASKDGVAGGALIGAGAALALVWGK